MADEYYSCSIGLEVGPGEWMCIDVERWTEHEYGKFQASPPEYNPRVEDKKTKLSTGIIL